MSNMWKARELLELALAECENEWGSREGCANAIEAALKYMKEGKRNEPEAA